MGMYYDNDEVEKWIAEYLAHENRTCSEALAIRSKIMVEVQKVVKGVVYTHAFHRYEPVEDCIQEAMCACLKALDTFDASFITTRGTKTTSFNFFSLVAVRSLKYWTIRQQKHRLTADIDDSPDLAIEAPDDSDWIHPFIARVRKHMSQNAKKYMIPCVDVLEDYLKIEPYSKRNFFKYMGSFNFSVHSTRRFLAEIKSISFI